MSGTLIGVFIGGLIAWVAPLLTLRYGERRWRFEKTLEHLKAERSRFDAHDEQALKLFCDPLTVIDGYSRFLLRCQALHSTRVDEAKPVKLRLPFATGFAFRRVKRWP
jgi:hypothetical protein